MAKPVVIVGAGVAGLTCARKLHAAGMPILLLDADDRPGGRLKTDVVDGFRLDRGFQVYFTAYPNGAKELDTISLDLMPFRNGAYIFNGSDLDLLDQRKKLAFLRSKVLPQKDKMLLAKLRGQARDMIVPEARQQVPGPTDEFLTNYGFSETFMERFARPFFGGVFADPSLKTDVRQFMFVWKMLVDGEAALPNLGIEEIPKQIAARVPRYLMRMRHRVAELIQEDGRVTGVRLDTKETIEASAVVLATEADEAARLSGLKTVDGHNSSICLYYETATPCVDGAYIVVNGSGKGMVNSVAPVTSAAPGYAPVSKHIAAVTILGESDRSDQELASEAQKELEAWFPHRPVNMWRFIRAYRLRYAQMAQPQGIYERLPKNATHTPGLFFAGEFTTNASIDGALKSGADCAAAILAQRQATETA